MAHKIERELKLGGWLKTAAHPPVLWLPKLHSEDTQLLLEQRQTDLDAWKVLALRSTFIMPTVSGLPAQLCPAACCRRPSLLKWRQRQLR